MSRYCSFVFPGCTLEREVGNVQNKTKQKNGKGCVYVSNKLVVTERCPILITKTITRSETLGSERITNSKGPYSSVVTYGQPIEQGV